jgi:tetratricopeptide (TPR) repeat protein
VKRKYFVFIVFFVFTIILQSFQCESPEFTTAKLAIRNKDLDKAELNLEKEIKNNPNNGEAYILLAEVRQMKNDFMGAAQAINSSDSVIKDFMLKVQAEQFKSNFWRLAYNAGIDLFNRYFGTKNKKFLDSAITIFKAGVLVRPQIYDFYPLIAQAYEVKEDSTNALEYFRLYTEMIKEELNLCNDYGIYTKMPREDFIAKVGKPKNTKGIRFSPQSDSILIDQFDLKGKEVYVYSNDKLGFFTIFGWRVNPPKHWPTNEKEQPTELNTTPFAVLAQTYFNRHDYEKTVDYIKKILLLEPDNTEANAFLINIYQLENKQNEAIEFAKTLIAKDPKNKLYHAIYGDILLQLGKYDDAITEYEKALAIDPNYDLAIRNCAAAYKNKVAVIQKRQLEENKINEKEYINDLEKSANLFERAKKTPRFTNDFEIYKDLAEIYFVMNKQDNLKQTVAEMEALDATVRDEDKEQYYLALLKIYSSFLKDEKKTKSIQERLENLKR